MAAMKLDVNRFMEVLRDYLFAPRAICLGCKDKRGADQGYLCAKCYSALQPLYLQELAEAPICAFCGDVKIGNRCPTCTRRNAKTLRAFAAYDYAEPVRQLVHEIKFSGWWRLADWMAQEMAKALASCPPYPATVITAVPLSKQRMRERGYNQSEKLGRALAQSTGIPYQNLLFRRVNTRQQATLSAKQRRNALKGAFQAIKPLSGQRVLLVDDVRTTGTTMVRCAEALFEAGAEDVAVISFACALKHPPLSRRYNPDRGIKLIKPEPDDF